MQPLLKAGGMMLWEKGVYFFFWSFDTYCSLLLVNIENKKWVNCLKNPPANYLHHTVPYSYCENNACYPPTSSSTYILRLYRCPTFMEMEKSTLRCMYHQYGCSLVFLIFISRLCSDLIRLQWTIIWSSDVVITLWVGFSGRSYSSSECCSYVWLFSTVSTLHFPVWCGSFGPLFAWKNYKYSKKDFLHFVWCLILSRNLSRVSIQCISRSAIASLIRFSIPHGFLFIEDKPVMNPEIWYRNYRNRWASNEKKGCEGEEKQE